MFNALYFVLGLVFLVACGGYEANVAQDLGPRVYLSAAKTSPSLFENYRCPSNPSKVQVCHVPPGNPAAKHTICIGLPAVDAHVGHHIAGNGEEDYLGDCNASQDPTPDDVGSGTGGTTGDSGSGSTDGGSTGTVDGGSTGTADGNSTTGTTGGPIPD